MNRISFTDSDYSYPNLESTAITIADFLFKYTSKVEDFCELMRNSSAWNINNYFNQLESWLASYFGRRRKKAAFDTQQFITLSHLFFSVCNNNDEIKKMRGLVPEKLVEKIFSIRYKDKNCTMGFGKVVNINNIPVIYSLEESQWYDHGPEDSDRSRQSVDAGAWDIDKEYGEFVEVKFKPASFHTKDIKYLRVLADALNTNQIQHQIMLVAFGNKELIEEKLMELSLWNPQEFTLIGIDEVFSLQHVS